MKPDKKSNLTDKEKVIVLQFLFERFIAGKYREEELKDMPVYGSVHPNKKNESLLTTCSTLHFLKKAKARHLIFKPCIAKYQIVLPPDFLGGFFVLKTWIPDQVRKDTNPKTSCTLT